MARVNVASETQFPAAGYPPTVQKLVSITTTNWHAQWTGTAALVIGAFTDPSAAEVDRIPQMSLSAGGTPETYTITGTWNDAPQTDTITTVANTTVQGNKPFDTITDVAGDGPGAAQTLDMQWGDSYADPPARGIATGAGGVMALQLSGESAVKTLPAAPANKDIIRSIRRVGVDAHAIADSYLLW